MMNKEIRFYISGQYISISKVDDELSIEIGTEPEDSNGVIMTVEEIKEFIEALSSLIDRKG